MADALAMGVNIIGRIGGAESSSIDNRYIDLIRHKGNTKDAPKASDIINNVIQMGHLEVSD